MYLDDAGDPPAIVCQVGGTQLKYDRRAIDDLHAMLKAHGDWMPLGGADEQKPAPDGTVEAWGRSARQPGRWLVRPQEGPARPVRRVHAAAAGGARPGRGHPRRQEQQDAGPEAHGHGPFGRPVDPFDALGDAEPPGDRGAPRRRASARSGSSPTALPISRPAVSRHLRLLKEAGSRRRGAARHAPDLPPPRRGRRRGPALSRAGVGRGRRPLPARRREHDARAVIEPIRLAFDVDAPPAHAFDVWTARISQWWPADHTVTAAPRPDRRPRAAPGWPDLRAHGRRRRARLGRGDRLGAAAAGSSTCGTCGATAPTRPRSRSGSSIAAGEADAGRDRASRLGGPRRRRRGLARPEPRRLGDAPAALRRGGRGGSAAGRPTIGHPRRCPAGPPARSARRSRSVARTTPCPGRSRPALPWPAASRRSRAAVPAVDPDRREAHALGRHVVVEQALGDVEDLARAAARSARARPRSCAGSACSRRARWAVTTQSNVGRRVAPPIARTGRRRSW